MKKLIVFFSVVIVIICIVVVTVIIFNKNINTFELNNKLVLIDLEKITSVRMIESTEGGNFYYKTEEKAIIRDIYNALNNIKIGRMADINVVDDSREYIFDLNDGTKKTFSFNSNFYYTNHTTYETENYKELKKIEIPRTKSWE